MIVAILQPYFFPYIGYFQLMQAVDVVVIYDDAQYMKGGWINRNRIRYCGKPIWLTLPVRRDRRELPINQREYLLAGGDAAQQIERRLQASYAGAPCYDEAMPVVSALLEWGEANVAAFNAHLLMALARQLGIGCRVELSSRIDKPAELKGQARVIDLCQRIGANHYVNPIGGTELYDRESFERVGMQLSFLRTLTPPAELAEGPQHLSIIDGLVNEGFAGCRARLTQCERLAAG